MAFITEGKHVFSMLKNNVSKASLCKTLTSCHGIQKELVENENLFASPWLNTATWILHPSPASLLSLRFTFEKDPKLGDTASPFFRAIADTVDCFKLCLSTKILFDMYDANPTEFFINRKLDSSGVLDNVAYTQDKLNLVNSIGVIFYNIFSDSVQELSDHFSTALRCYFALGVVPLKQQRSKTKPRGKSTITIHEQLASIASALKETLRQEQNVMINGSEIFQDILITLKRGKHNCSTINNPVNLLLTSFDNGMEQFSTTDHTDYRPPLIEMIIHEIDNVYGSDVARHQTLDKLLQTQVVVTSQVEKETEKNLDELRQNRQEEKKSLKIMGEVVKDVARHSKLVEDRAQAVEQIFRSIDESEHLTPAQEEAISRASAKMSSSVQESIKTWINLKESIYNSTQGELHEQGVPGSGSQLEDIHTIDFGALSCPGGRVHSNPGENQKALDAHRRDLVEREQARKFKKMEQTLTMHQKKSTNLVKELTLAQVKILNRQEKIVELESQLKESHVKTRRQEQSNQILKESVKKLQEEVVGLRHSVEEAISNSSTSQKDTERLIAILNTDKNSNYTNTHDKSIHTALQIIDQIKLVLEGSLGILCSKFIAKKQVDPFDKIDMEETKITKLLRRCNIHVSPMNPDVRCLQDMHMQNIRMPKEWMCDRDAHFQMPENWSHGRDLKLPKGYVALETPHLKIFDINPPDDYNKRAIKNSMRNIEGISTVDEIYTKRTLNMQFSSTNNVESFVRDPLKRRWICFVKRWLYVDTEALSKGGQRIQQRITKRTIEKYVVPYMLETLGDHEWHRYVDFVTSFYEDIMSTGNQNMIVAFITYINEK